VIGLVLALIVVGIVISFFGLWIVGVVFGVVALALFLLFVLGFTRRAAKSQP
jgi:hypothetical protein